MTLTTEWPGGALTPPAVAITQLGGDDMTDPTVSAYYSHPGTLVCEHCRAVWRITPSHEADDIEFILESHDTHVCDPDVDPAEVEAVRDAARKLAKDLPPKPPGGDMPITETTRSDDPDIVRLAEHFELQSAAGTELVIAFDCREALLDTACPHFSLGEGEQWEEILHSAKWSARHASEPDAARAERIARVTLAGIPMDTKRTPPRLFTQAAELVPTVWDDRPDAADRFQGAPDSIGEAQSILRAMAERASGIL